MPSIMLGQEPDRTKAIDDVCQMIRNCAQAGIPSLKYNMSILGVVRTEPTPGRGECRALFHIRVRQGAVQDPPLTEAGPGDGRDLLGEDRALFEASRAGGGRIQGEDCVPSSRSGDAFGTWVPGMQRRCLDRSRD